MATRPLLGALLLLVPTAAADEPAVADLERAKAVHARELARLRDKLSADIDAVIKAEAARGAGVDYLLKEKRGFERNGVVPILPKLLPASREFLAGQRAADEALAAKYPPAIAALARAGRTDDANALRDELRALRGPGPGPADRVPADLAGTWVVRFTNQVTRTYAIGPDGSISCTEEGSVRRARLRPHGKSFVVEFGDGTLDRLTLVTDGRLLDEHYRPSTDFAADKPVVMGVGTVRKTK